MDWRGGPDELAFCASEEARALCRQGPLTPNHMIRTKALPLFVEEPAWQSDEALRAQLAEEVAAYRVAYDAYFEEQCRAKGALPTKLDSAPRVVLLPGAGALCFGKTKREARIAGDISEHTLRTKALAQAAGRYEALSASHLFDMEYWSLEQAKLGSGSERPLERQVVLVTGGAGAIGVGIGEACAAAGAHVVLADIDAARAERAARALEERHGAGSALGLAMDVTDADSVRGSFDIVCTAYGGVDVVVPNAGVALVARVSELTSEQVRRLTEVNYLGVVLSIREAARVFRAQGTGGHIVINSSKNVFAPGADFGAYSASKAAAHQIGKVAALELAELGVRVNLINADAVFSEGEVRSGLWEEVGPGRAKSRGMTLEELPEFYRQRNLLRTRVSGRHVGNAVVFFASNLTPTTGATLPVDGGVAAAFPR
jgi:NAD(P)-dependent dehydrogenase (short-subunit alcohol dehydrogenase family)